jgi:hypothetical protein
MYMYMYMYVWKLGPSLSLFNADMQVSTDGPKTAAQCTWLTQE